MGVDRSESYKFSTDCALVRGNVYAEFERKLKEANEAGKAIKIEVDEIQQAWINNKAKTDSLKLLYMGLGVLTPLAAVVLYLCL